MDNYFNAQKDQIFKNVEVRVWFKVRGSASASDQGLVLVAVNSQAPKNTP